jgi:hypothetical protein
MLPPSVKAGLEMVRAAAAMRTPIIESPESRQIAELQIAKVNDERRTTNIERRT